MRLLFIGDVVGKPGRNCLQKILPKMINLQHYDLIVANGENAAGGTGITEKAFFELKETGVDLLTGGNHIWDKKDVFNFIDQEPGLIRPLNYPPETTPGSGYAIVERSGIKIAVINLVGRVFMDPADCPFRTAENKIFELESNVEVIIVDMHAEATSEKQAMGWFLNGKVSAVIGTHSHVQTADERILPGKTAYITDVGMAGLYDSILGVDKKGPLQRFLTRLPHKLEISKGREVFNAVDIEIDEKSGEALSIRRIYELT